MPPTPTMVYNRASSTEGAFTINVATGDQTLTHLEVKLYRKNEVATIPAVHLP